MQVERTIYFETMRARDLIGCRINDVRVAMLWDVDGLDHAEAWVVLDNGNIVSVPYAFGDVLQIHEFPTNSESIFPQAPPTSHGVRRERGQWLAYTEPASFDVSIMRGQKIVNLIRVPDSAANAYIMLENGALFTHHLVAPHGTGTAGVEWEPNMDDLQSRWDADLEQLIPE